MADYTVSLGVPSDWRQAVVKPHDLTAAVTIGLWEAAGNNRGMNIKVFPDRDSALEWLTGPDSESELLATASRAARRSAPATPSAQLVAHPGPDVGRGHRVAGDGPVSPTVGHRLPPRGIRGAPARVAATAARRPGSRRRPPLSARWRT